MAVDDRSDDPLYRASTAHASFEEALKASIATGEARAKLGLGTPTPSICRMVRYAHQPYAGAPHVEDLPAIVIAAHGTACHLAVIPAETGLLELLGIADVPYDAEGGPGTWRWPERA